MTEGVTRIFKPGHELIDPGRVCCLKPVIAELIQGAKTEIGVNVMKDLADVFPLLAGWTLSFQLRKAGGSVWLSDCYIGTVAEENDATIYTLDRRFKDIQSHIDITFLGQRDRRKKDNHDWL